MTALGTVVLVVWLAAPALAQDPFVWTTYLGGRFNDDPTAITVDANGLVYVVGVTQSDDFPITAGALNVLPPKSNERGSGHFRQVQAGRQVGFLAKVDTAGKRLLYGTYVGGSVRDSVNAIAVGSKGQVCLGGGTDSPDLPVTSNAPQKPYLGKGRGHINNPGDGFVLCLSRTGELEFGTFLGGSASDVVSVIVAGAGGFVYVTGSTASTNFFTDDALTGAVVGFVIKIDVVHGKIVWVSRLGDGGTTTPTGIALGIDGTLFVAGSSDGLDDRASAGGQDAFVAEMDLQGKLIDVMLFGGSQDETAVGPVIDSNGAVYVAGQTRSSDLNTTAGAYQRRYQGGASDSFVAKFGAGPAQSYVTYLGAASYEDVRGIAVNGEGRVHVVGRLSGRSNFPITPDTPPPARGTSEHLFYAVLDPLGARLEFSLRRGGQSQGAGRFRITKFPRVALGPCGDAHILAMTTDDVAASAGTYQTERVGGHEPVLFRLSAPIGNLDQRGRP